MISISIKRNFKKEIMSYSVIGHANASEYGKDIVCASISVLAQTAILSLHELLGIDVVYKMEDGYLHCNIPSLTDDLRQKADLILEAMVIGMKGTEESYKQYISLVEEEV
ncbi:ribosomal-processing cysteine protease Prp [Inediibacterium massiliense]|uniref:ribosomal-processing cysteine protease Prp n=1 Tax=Inediibacterium massiliense TaxID=1658111 RepID=UPI0006B49C7A|nr:ribosomal-processing cysteine protease Prp [Inediibacterium massiliense]